MSNAQDTRHILVVEDQKSKRIVALRDNTYSIGRDPTSAIIIYDRQVSRHHATLLRVTDYQNHQDFYRVIDGNLQGKRSTNGIMVNGKYCLSHELKPGDVIRFGTKAKASYQVISGSSELELDKNHDNEPSLSEIFGISNIERETEIEDSETKTALAFSTQTDEDPPTNILRSSPQLSEFSPNPILEFSPLGEITYLNPAANVRFPSLRQLHREHPILKGLLDQVITHEKTSYVRDIEVDDFSYEQHIVYLVDNQLIRTYLFDVTKYKKAENQLNYIGDYYKFLVQQTTEGILLVDAKNKQVIEANSAYCKLLGYGSKEITNLNIYGLIALEKEVIDNILDPLSIDSSFYVEESLHRCQDGSLVSVEEKITRSIFNNKEIFCFAVRDVSDRKKAEERLQYQSFHDPLTNLPNRLLFNKQLSLAIANAQRNQSLLAVMFLDLDSFQNINNTLGHSIGDELLQTLAIRLTNSLRAGDTVARWGSDEFTLLLPRIKNTEDTVKLAERIFENLKQPFQINEHELQIKVSIGIAIYPQDGEDKENLLKNADAALSRTKTRGRNNYQFYAPSMSSESARLLKLETAIHMALDKQQFSLCYQPQVHMTGGKITGIEALIRWQHPEFGIIAPGKFLHLAEKTDLMLHIGKWVLKTACEQNLSWQRDGLPPVTMSVNLSGVEFQQPNLVESVARLLEKIGLDPQWLELEITEKTLRQNLQSARQIFQDFQSLGVRIGLDDFGRGYSALGYLKQFPFRTLKLDQVFIRDLRGNAQERAIISAAMALGKGFNFRVVAKGVETEQQAEILRTLDCNEAQGYLFSRPLSPEATYQFLSQKAQKQVAKIVSLS
ncbi:MAG: hypothetical protein N5P05_001217 [Chroococcopsis gigantea SAG 12.99]|jgi:diguanylate cyclase (GGDEF)-like protein/PAS domain S-box-containing protein|nr:EAL domain-containing protein [Chlorogloea purpurea SAG 13.99]MDV2999611.1 hypothetical protein [Chroococcopsis gigantea SAG 12.99]